MCIHMAHLSGVQQSLHVSMCARTCGSVHCVGMSVMTQACTANHHAAASFACSNGAVQVLGTLVLAHGNMLMCRHHHKRDNAWI